MSFWRLDLTVLTDLSASMFAACFMILLIFLSLVQERAHETPPQFEAKAVLRLVERHAEPPAGLVELLHLHDSSAGAGIDLFADRIEVTTAQGTRRAALREIGVGLAGIAGPVRLYVFSNTLYNRVVTALGPDPKLREITVPDALRDSHAPMTAWSTDFLALSARQLDLPSFRQGLGKLLQGGPEPASGGAVAAPAAPDLPARVQTWISAGLAMLMPLLGLVAVGWIERRRRRLGGLDRA